MRETIKPETVINISQEPPPLKNVGSKKHIQNVLERELPKEKNKQLWEALTKPRGPISSKEEIDLVELWKVLTQWVSRENIGEIWQKLNQPINLHFKTHKQALI